MVGATNAQFVFQRLNFPRRNGHSGAMKPSPTINSSIAAVTGEPAARSRVAAVVIGRNEGERLDRCLRSLLVDLAQVVYVDSGSTDGSIELASRLGALVVELDRQLPFTAARARNTGWRQAVDHWPEVELIQFVDGDCELRPGWLEQAVSHLLEHPQTAVVCGRRRERAPERSVWNRLCDFEWDTPIGPARQCGGDALMRVRALLQVEGYRDELIAGEEPELCVRLRDAGWQIERIDAEMTWHDADMLRLGQWWRRAERSGHAYAEGALLHGGSREHFALRPLASIVFWALLWPLCLVGATPWIGHWAWLGLVAYGVHAARIVLRRRRQTAAPWRDAITYAIACMAAKWAQLIGASRYALRRLAGRRPSLIEYK